jgi:oxygen-dependent protoporphyrinogen oxidase
MLPVKGRRVAVVGGGLAGVTAAWELSRGGAEVVLFEASHRLGGIVETVRADGFVIECGPDGWVTEKPWARELAEELGLGGELIASNDATRTTYILRDGRLVALPDGMRMMVPSDLAAVDASPLFSGEAKRAFHVEQGRAEELKAAAPEQDESVASFVRRHFGGEVLATVGRPLLSGVFGGDVETLSVRAVMAPFVAMEREFGSLIVGLRARQRREGTEPVFTTLRSGVETLVSAMVRELPPGMARVGAPVRALGRTPVGWRVDGEAFGSVMLALPVDAAASLLAPIDARAAELMEMEASSAVVVAFGFAERFPVPPGFGFLVPPVTGSDSLLAATFVEQKFAGRVPEGARLLRAFFGGEAGARLLAAPEGEIAALALRQLAAILGPLPPPVVRVVRRWPRSLPQYAVGHLERMAELERRVRLPGGLWLLGNGYRGVGLPDLVRDARAAARECLG